MAGDSNHTMGAPPSVPCVVMGCGDPAHPVEVRINTYANQHKDTRVRLTVLIPLCQRHSFIHGYTWTSKPLPYDGAFPADYEAFHDKRVGPL